MVISICPFNQKSLHTLAYNMLHCKIYIIESERNSQSIINLNSSTIAVENKNNHNY